VHFFDSQRRGRGKERTIQDAYLSSNVRMAPVAGGVDNELQLSGIFRVAIQNVPQFQIYTSPRGKTQRRRAFERYDPLKAKARPLALQFGRRISADPPLRGECG